MIAVYNVPIIFIVIIFNFLSQNQLFYIDYRYLNVFYKLVTQRKNLKEACLHIIWCMCITCGTYFDIVYFL